MAMSIVQGGPGLPIFSGAVLEVLRLSLKTSLSNFSICLARYLLS